MRIAVDVMGGDHGCEVVIEGVKRALESDLHITTLYLVGQQSVVEAAMTAGGLQDRRIEVIHASEVLTMDEKPANAVRKKRDCSIARAVELVHSHKADAVISRGNTGGIFAAATFKLGRLPGVDRGAIATVIPTPESAFVLLDAGANIECKPIHLVHYAVMGSVYAREVRGVKNPRVGLMSIGREESKGNELTLEAFKLLKQTDLNFVGNVEGHDLFESYADVIVCDGFVGNVILKTCESLAKGIFTMLRHELTQNPKRQLGALLAQNAFRAIKRRLDPEAHGGAPLLGFSGTVMKAHGSSRERAITSAIRITVETAQHHVPEIIAREVARANERLEAAAGQMVSVPLA